MDLRDLFHQIGTTYDRHLDMQSDAQRLLRDSSREVLEPLVPAGYVIKGSGGQGAGAHVPWIAVFNPDETTKAQHGMYVVYLFRADMQVVYLSLEQGVTELVDLHGRTKAREILASQALAIRANMPTLQSYLAQISLGVRENLPLDYEAGNIGALEYSVSNLPSAQQLADDLDQMLLLYENALEVRDALRIKMPNTILTTKPELQIPTPGAEFKPKSSEDYVQNLKEQQLVKSRSHEKVVEQYGEFLMSKGLKPNTKVHPRDLTATHDEQEWLIEVKVVRKGNAGQATREAIAQLLMYRDFIYGPDTDVRVLAVFSEAIGELYASFLEKYGIGSVWKTPAGWAASPSAVAADMVG
ncbi:MAG: DUF3578 domain-containing protein [Akkermansiaceae bacterium]|nr:DUF3578 domain-containing protein [Akkermansiaceae bacterium]